LPFLEAGAAAVVEPDLCAAPVFEPDLDAAPVFEPDLDATPVFGAEALFVALLAGADLADDVDFEAVLPPLVLDLAVVGAFLLASPLGELWPAAHTPIETQIARQDHPSNFRMFTG
jgi:hypothetical protein